jgi:type VI secretion system protein ImpI
MRLTLTQTGGQALAAGERWSMEEGRRIIGRAPECDWQVPDTGCKVSKLHCTVSRDHQGFVLRDESANGTRVGDVLLLEGETARLRNGDRIEFGSFSFEVSVSGEERRVLDDPEANLPLGDDTVTVTSILADIAPGGSMANGILGRRDAEPAWPAGGNPAQDAGSPSRNVEIGWGGPPEPSASGPILPEDWNDSFDYGSQLEHASATRASIPVRTVKAPGKDDAQGSTDEAANVAAPWEHEQPDTPGHDSQNAARQARLESHIERCEIAFQAVLDVFDLEQFQTDTASGFLGAGQDDAPTSRLDRLAARQALLASALDGLVRKVSPFLEPRLIEAAVDAEGWRPPWRADRSYWQAYCRTFERDGVHVSVRDLFRQTMQQVLDESGNGSPG